MNQEKKKAKLEMWAALLKLQEAWMDCLYAFGNIHIDVNDYILGSEDDGDEYPFQKSFEELNVIPWIEGTIKRLDAEVED